MTKEYLGEDTHLAYLGPMWEEVLQSDTHAQGQGLDWWRASSTGRSYGHR